MFAVNRFILALKRKKLKKKISDRNVEALFPSFQRVDET